MPDYGHTLLNKYPKVVGRCICKYTYVLKEAPLKIFKADLLESISTSVMINEGIDSWVPCLDPSIKKLYNPLDKAIEDLYYAKVKYTKKGPK